MADGENVLVSWLQQRFGANDPRVVIGIGDDMAAVRFGGEVVAITADMLLDGVHFDSRRDAYELIGRKAIACSLSDCAAMGCRPRAATVSIALSRGMTLDDVQWLYEGMAEIATRYGWRIVGGDTTSWPHPLVIDVAMLAEPMNARGPIRRSTAQVGDTIYVSGTLGGSILGKHLMFEPLLDLASRLAPDPGVHAMMDISDGLALDLHRLCTASHCDVELTLDALRTIVSPDAQRRSADDRQSPLDHALSDGEDYELLVVGEAGLNERHRELTPVGQTIAPVAVGTGAMWLIAPDGRRIPLEPKGYEHGFA